MAYIQVEASVRTHKKFLKAGPAASWLWLCGMGYCQDGLTDGFIPFEAIDYLGIKATTARKLKCTLVSVKLWDEIQGGWQVHDYLSYNKSAEEIQKTKAIRGAGGAKGGRPTKDFAKTETLEVTGKVSDKVNLTENPSHLISSHLISATATPTRATPPPLVTNYRQATNNAHFSLTCGHVPNFLHAEFIGKLLAGGASQVDADRQMLEFYEATDARFVGTVVGDEPLRFWRARFAERWPVVGDAPVRRDNRPAWAQAPKAGAR